MTKPFRTDGLTIDLLRSLAGEGYSDKHRINVNRYFEREGEELAVAIAYVDVCNVDWEVKTYGTAVGYSGGGCFDSANFIIWPSGRALVIDGETTLRPADHRMLCLVDELLGDYYDWDDSTACMPVFNGKATKLMRRTPGQQGLYRLVDETFEAFRLARIEEQWPVGFHFVDNN